MANNPYIIEKKQKLYQKKVRKYHKKRLYYLSITAVLLILVFQAVRGAYLNVVKYFVLNKQLHKLEYISNKVVDKNANLKRELQSYTSTKGIEALARDNLNMVGKDEVLVLIKKSKSSTDD